MDRDAISAFIESWGTLGAVWGLNASTARVHALLIVSEDPISLDQIAKRLKISRGNASMCLKDLRAWGVIKLYKVPGDRRDYYECEPDIWRMFFAIGRERKRREFDPTLAALREALKSGRQSSGSKAGRRLLEMEDLLGTLDRIVERFLAEEDKARSVMSFLSGYPKK